MTYDDEITAIADYVLSDVRTTALAQQTAGWCLLDSIACALAASASKHCQHLLSLGEGGDVPIIGTGLTRAPGQAAFANGLLVRWLDYNDTWLAAEWGHPSDNLGALLVACYLKDASVADLLQAMIKAYEIQGVLACENSFNAHGFDHVVLVKLASTALVTALNGGTHGEICAAISQSLLDGGTLRAYRHAPNVGPRKSWASGDACARAWQLATLTLAGEPGYASVVTTERWGFADTLLGGQALVRNRDYGCYVMENILFKASFPAEFHAQTAAEAALALHKVVRHRLDAIQTITIKTQAAGDTIINKSGALPTVAARDHCLQYIVAVVLCYGELTSAHYEAPIAADPRIDALRDKMQVVRCPKLTAAYHDAKQRAIGNALQITFADGEQTDWHQVDYPLGHVARRHDVLPALKAKFARLAALALPDNTVSALMPFWDDDKALARLSVSALLAKLTP